MVLSRVLANARNHIVRKYIPFLHRGVDVVKDANKVSDVIAHSNGIVTQIVEGRKQNSKAKGKEKYGNYVRLKHDNGYYTLYAHLNVIYVHVGQNVGQGDVLGKMGNSGKTTGTYLHFEVQNKKEKSINPTKYLEHDFYNCEKKSLSYRAYDSVLNRWLTLVKEREGIAGIFGHKLGGIFIQTNVDDLQFSIYKNGIWSSYVLVDKEAMVLEQDGIQGICLKSDCVKLMYRVHTLDNKWTDWFYNSFHEKQPLEQKNFIDAIEIYLMEE